MKIKLLLEYCLSQDGLIAENFLNVKNGPASVYHVCSSGD